MVAVPAFFIDQMRHPRRPHPQQIRKDYRGDRDRDQWYEVWSRFKAAKDGQLRYYRAMVGFLHG